MSADVQRKAYRYTCNMIRPQIYSERSLMESVVDFFSDVVPQAYSSTQKVEDKEKIQWVRFENCDCNDISKNPDLYRSDTKGLPLLLILGYSNGVQIWHVTSNGEAQELMSIRQGPVRIFRMLPNPDPALGYPDAFASKRPLAVVCDSSSAGTPYCGIKFISLKTGDEVHSVSYKTLPVQTIECNKRFLAVVFLEKICVYDACQFKQLFWVTSCYPCPGPTVNPVALSSRWIAYADKRLVAMHQSCGGMSGDGSQSYAATVISAAKGAMKGMSMFGEAIVNTVTGCKTPGVKKQEVVHLDNGNRPGIVTVVDIQNVHNDSFNVNEDNEGSGLIAHFHAHANEPVSDMAFDSTGTLLVTACKLGHNFHVFRLMAHPCTSSLGAVHHLYTLHRGDTTAKVIDISFNQDSRWVTVSTHRGTTHIFPITPYGGPVNVRTHCQPHIVNRASRFHKSAGLEDIERSPMGRRSPILSTSPGSSGQYDRYPTLIQQNTLNNNMGNPRLPPYPHPITVYPLYQIKQPLNVVLNPSNKNQSPSHSPTGLDNMYCVCARFSSPRLCVIGSPKLDVDRREKGGRPVDSLYIMTQSGNLVEYILEPKARAVLDKVTEDCTLDLAVTGRMQWNLQRLKASQELRPPLPSNSPLILANEAVISQIPTSADLIDHIGLTRQDSKDSLSSEHSNKDDDEQWLAQVEIITHAGPHRRLWMGPQFSFKTYQENTTVLSSNSSALLSQSPESNMAAMDIMGEEGDLESLKVQPARSNPVTMPTNRPAYRRLSGSDSSPSPGLGQITPLMIEAGSFDQSPYLLDVYTNWTESTVEKQPRGSDDLEEDRLKQTLADAMVESPIKDIDKLSLRQDLTRPTVTKSKKKNKAQEVTSRKKQSDKTEKEGGETVASGAAASRSVSNKESQTSVVDKRHAKPDQPKDVSKTPTKEDCKGKTTDTARHQESEEAQSSEPQKTASATNTKKSSGKSNNTKKTEEDVNSKPVEASSKAVKEEDKHVNKVESVSVGSKKAKGKKGKQNSGKESSISKKEKSKSPEVRFAGLEESISDLSMKETEGSGLELEMSTSGTKHSSNSQIGVDQIDNKAMSQSVQKNDKQVTSKECLKSENAANMEKEDSVLDSTISASDKKKSSSSTSLGDSKSENKVSSRSRSNRKNLKQSYTADTDPKVDVSIEEKESSIGKDEVELDKLKTDLPEKPITVKKESQKSISDEDLENETQSTSKASPITTSFVEPVDVQSTAQERNEEKETILIEGEAEVSNMKEDDAVSYDLVQTYPSRANKPETDTEVILKSTKTEVENAKSINSRPDVYESKSNSIVNSELDSSETNKSHSASTANLEIAEAELRLTEQKVIKKEDGQNTKEKKKKRKNGKKSPDSLKTEDNKVVQDKKTLETNVHSIELEDAHNDLKGKQPMTKEIRTDRKQIKKEADDLKRSKEIKNEVELHKHDEDAIEVLSTETLILEAIKETALVSEILEDLRHDDVEIDVTDVQPSSRMSSEVKEIQAILIEDNNFPSLPEKKDGNEGMFAVKSKKNRKKTSKMEESEYFDTAESIKDVEIESVSEKCSASAVTSSPLEKSSIKDKTGTFAEIKKESIEKPEIAEANPVAFAEGRERKSEPVANEDEIFTVKSKKKKKKKKNMMEDSVYENKQDDNLVQDNEMSVYLEATELADCLVKDKMPLHNSKTECVHSLNFESSQAYEAEDVESLDSVTEKTKLTASEAVARSNNEDTVYLQDDEPVAEVVQDINEILSNNKPSSWETAAFDDTDDWKESPTGNYISKEENAKAEEGACASGSTDHQTAVPLSNSSDRSSEERETELKVNNNSDRGSEERDVTAKTQAQKSDSKNRKKKRKNKK